MLFQAIFDLFNVNRVDKIIDKKIRTQNIASLKMLILKLLYRNNCKTKTILVLPRVSLRLLLSLWLQLEELRHNGQILVQNCLYPASYYASL